MERPKIQALNTKVGHKIDSNARCIRVRRGVRFLEPSFVAHGDEVVGIDGFDVCGDGGGPGGDGASGGVACA